MSFARYPEYKDSEAGWMGKIPAHWKIMPLYSIAVERNESNAGMLEDNLLSLSYGRIVNKDISSNDGLLPESFETYQIVRSDDIVFRLTDLQNDKRSLRSALVTQDGIITSAYVAIRPLLANARYLSHLYRFYDTTKVFYSMGGGLRQSMKFSDMRRLPTLIPPSEEQTAIATFLDRETAKIDTLVAEQEKLIALLQEKRQAVISHAVTKGLDPSVPMKDSRAEWLGEVPAHWEVRPLKHLAEFRSGGTPNKGSLDYWDGEVPWASAKDLKVEDLHDTVDHITDWALEAGAASLMPAGSVLVVVRGMILARTFPVVTARVPMAINQDLKALLPRQGVRADYLAALLRGSQVETLNRLDEAGHGTKALRMDAWGAMLLPVPPLEEQKEIAAHLRQVCDDLDASRGELDRAITLLQERRTALISAAVTGQIDVRGLFPMEAA